MISQRKAANALSGKTARPCDGCSRKRARWFCVADDAFLCQSCDDSVHSANPLADRHERVRLETASFKASDSSSSSTWHQGFTKKARTPRQNKFNQVKDGEKIAAMNSNSVPFVPEIEESNGDEDEDDLIYRVPVFDPFTAELCSSHVIGREEGSSVAFEGFGEPEKCDDLGNLQGFLPSDVDLAEFAADVENLLGKGLDDEDFKLLDCKEEDNDDDEKFDVSLGKKVKDEQEMEEIIDSHLNHVFGFGNESMDWSFGYESPGLARIDEDQVEQKVVVAADDGDAMVINGEEKKETKKRPSLLRLNYEAIINAWASQGSPWTTGNRPQLNLDDCLTDSMDGWGKDGNFLYGGGRRESNGAREARVLRYKEKRRTRLFSKKIRYEVRKLNAEKRPRMKGRFVKRTSFMPTSAFSYVNK